MKTACLLARLDRMPMVKLLAPFAAGIALAARYELPLWFLAGAFVVTGVVALLLRSGAAAAAMLLTTGFAAAQLRTPEVTVPHGVTTLCEVSVEGFPVERERYSVADAAVRTWRDPSSGAWHASQSRIRLYADSAITLRDGERQAFHIYSSAGAPTLLAGADTLAVTEYATCQYRTDSVSLRGTVEIKAIAGPLRDSVTLRVGNVLKPKQLQGPRRTVNPQPTN